MMRRLLLLFAPLLLLALFSAVAMADEDYTVQVHQDAKLGSYFTDSKGMTLYLFKKDTANTSACYDACAKAWPPFTTTGDLTLPDGVAGKLTTITRKDGTTQVAYNGVPLYYYTPDKAPGDVKGQGVGNVWFVMAPEQAVATQLPKAGGLPIGLLVGGGVALAVVGFGLRRRSRA